MYPSGHFGADGSHKQVRPLNSKIDNFFHFDFKSNSTLLVDAQKTNDAILLLFGKPGKTELPDWLLYVPAKSC